MPEDRRRLVRFAGGRASVTVPSGWFSRLMPWTSSSPGSPLATGELAKPGGPLDTLAERRGVSPSQLALAWLLHRSPVVLPIPGTSSVAHLEDNVAAAEIALSESEYAALEAAVS
jgi:aryl-alcohol dehydrogenase-like predicted oxidoreductase